MTLAGLTEMVERQLELAALSGEIDSVMRAVVSTAREALGGDGAALTVPRDDRLVFTVAVGTSAPLQGSSIPVEASLGGRCFLEGEAIVVDDLRLEPSAEQLHTDRLGGGSIVLAPLVHGERTLGVLSVHATANGAFGCDAARSISLMARSAAIALRNAQLVERLTSSERASRAIVEQSADAMLVFDSDLTVLAGNDAAAALLWYGREELVGMPLVAFFSDEDVVSRPLRREELLRRRELRTERSFLRKDGTSVPVEAAVRVLDDGRIHATLRDITQRQRNEMRLRESLDRLRGIVDLQREISELELDPGAVTDAILERTQRLTGADGASVLWLDDDAARWRYASGASAPFVGTVVDRHKSLAGLASSTGKTHYAPDVESDPRVDRAAAERVGIRSLICAPLVRGGVPVAVLSVSSGRPHAFDELAVETTRLMAEFVSAALRNVEELETRRRLVDALRTQGEVVEHMQMGLYIWERGTDDVFRLEYANAASEEQMKRPVADVLGRPLDEVLPGTAGFADGLFRRVVESGGVQDVGEIAYADDLVGEGIFSMKVFALDRGRVAVTFENVTERVLAARALQESEERFRGAFHGASTGMSLHALDGSILQANECLAQMLGYTVEELEALGVRDLTHPDDRADDARNSQALNSGAIDSVEREKRYVRKDGSTAWGRVSVALIRDYEGRPALRVAHVTDVTERKEAEHLFASMFERSDVPMLILGDDRRLAAGNEASATLLGVDREELLELRLDDLTPGQPVERAWRRFLEHGTAEGETTVQRPDGGSRLVEYAATAHAQPGRHIVVIRDLTRQKDLELQLRQAQKMEAVGRLAGGIAHDFNNLLTAISGYSEFLTASLEDARLRRHAEEIRKAASRAASLTGQLLAFSRRQVLQPRVLDLNAVVEDMEMMLRRLIGEDVELVAMLDPDLGAVRADPTQIEQVIVNLAVNARDAMPTGGSAIVRTRNVETEDGSFVELGLTDTGIGMTREERLHLFDPFFTTKDGGTGLGLATVYGIVEQSGGTIEVDSEPGLGSSFRILLPRVAHPDAAAVAGPETSGPENAGSETILLVEDESVVRQLVAEILETSGYTVLQATDGPSALELLRRHTGSVDLLVTDVVMPGMSGPDVAKAVTSMRPGTQVLFTSGYTDSAIDHHGVLQPGIAFLQKPFSADDLTRKVRSLVEAPPAAVA